MSRTPSTAQRGFTLLEIILALIVLGLLAAFAAGKYIDMRAQTEARICAANRAQLTANIRSYWLRKVTAGEDTEGLIQKGFDAIAIKPVCPTTGKGYRLVVSKDKDDVFVIVCDTHNSGDGTLGDTLKNYMTNDDYVASGGTVIGGGIVPTFEKGGTGVMDSGAVEASGSWSAQVNAQLNEQGIDLAQLGAPHWRYDKGSHTFVWTTVDITDLPAGSWIPVIRYNAQNGTYTVWRTTLRSQTTTNNGITSDPYNAIDNPVKSYAPSTGDKAENQTYDNALKLYNELLKTEYPGLTGTAPAMQAAVNTMIDGKNNGTAAGKLDATSYDSAALTASGTKANSILSPLMDHYGVDKTTLGFRETKTWRFETGNGIYSVTPADLNDGTYRANQPINVIQFVPYSYGATGGTYRVVATTVGSNPKGYLYMNVPPNPAANQIKGKFATYEEALAYYKEHPKP